MCTVSFIPVGNTVYLTHNRDEKYSRPAAIPPRVYHAGGHSWLLPRDTAAGGSWAALNDRGEAAVLLNGAFERHLPQVAYRKSRGLVFLDIISAADKEQAIRDAELHGIEPFTLIMFTKERLLEFRWDGEDKHFFQLDARMPHFWCSVTLYDPVISAQRRRWFTEWIQGQPFPGAEDIVDFHMGAGDGDEGRSLVINRKGEMLTVSISSISIAPGCLTMQYFDARDKRHYSCELIAGKTVPISL